MFSKNPIPSNTKFMAIKLVTALMIQRALEFADKIENKGDVSLESELIPFSEILFNSAQSMIDSIEMIKANADASKGQSQLLEYLMNDAKSLRANCGFIYDIYQRMGDADIAQEFVQGYIKTLSLALCEVERTAHTLLSTLKGQDIPVKMNNDEVQNLQFIQDPDAPHKVKAKFASNSSTLHVIDVQYVDSDPEDGVEIPQELLDFYFSDRTKH